MGRALQIRALTPSQLRQAFPLIQAIIPSIALEAWLGYADAALDGQDHGTRGIVAAQGTDGYIYGLFCYRITLDLGHGRTLSAEHFVVLDPVDRVGATQALLGAIDRIAHQKGCAYVRVDVPHKAAPDGALGSGPGVLLLQAGYRVERLQLGRAVGEASGQGTAAGPQGSGKT